MWYSTVLNEIKLRYEKQIIKTIHQITYMYKDKFSIGCKQWYSKACSVKVKGSERVLRWFHFPSEKSQLHRLLLESGMEAVDAEHSNQNPLLQEGTAMLASCVAGLHHLTSQSNRGDFPHMYLFSHRTTKKIALIRNTA